MTRRWSDRAWVAVIIAGAVALRVVPMWPIIFTPAYTNFQTNDSWYHMRLIEYVVRHFPHPLATDPFLANGGDSVPVAPFFDLSVAAVALILGLGSPSASLVNHVAALAPVAYAAVTIAAAHAIGVRFFGARAALLGATILAIVPGPFLERTRLGYVDHHAAEACFAALTMLGIMRAQDARGSPRDEIRAATIAGVWLGCYLLTWTSGSFLVFIITLWLVVQTAVDVVADRAGERFRSVAPTLAMALALVLLFQPRGMGRFDQQVAALAASLAVLGGLEGGRWLLSRGGRRARVSRLVAPLLVVATVVTVIALFLFERVLPDLAARMWIDAARLVPSATNQTVQEMRPAMYVLGSFSIRATWLVFGPSFFIGLAACVAFLPLSLRRGTPAYTLFAVWSLVVGAATFGQSRFGYYFALNAALLTGWVAGLCLDWAGVASRDAPPTGGARRLLADGAVVVVAALVFYPNVRPAWRTVHSDDGLPVAWHDALDWMKRTQPPAFDGPELFDAAPAILARASLTPHYTVMSWWDYGYWIMQVAQRVPVSNPTQAGARTAGRFFTETDLATAGKILDRWRARLIVADAELPLRLHDGGIAATGKFRALGYWAGVPTSRFFGEYQEGDEIVTVFYPEYYKTMAVRLAVYGGAAVVPSGSIWVITSVPAIGDPPRAIIDSRQFSTYEEAEQFAATPGPGRRQIVGRDPGRTCVPLPALPDYRLVYDSPQRSWGAPVPAVRIFEWQPVGSLSVVYLPDTSRR